MRIEIEEIKNINATMFEYTSDISKENIEKKGKKYQKSDKLVFIVGTRWPSNNKRRTIVTIYKNIE